MELELEGEARATLAVLEAALKLDCGQDSKSEQDTKPARSSILDLRVLVEDICEGQ